LPECDKILLPKDGPYFFLGGSSLLAIDPLLACLKTTHPEWKVRDIRSGKKAITEEWINEFITRNNGWKQRKDFLLRQRVVILLQRAEREIEPLKAINK
jgi:hypothetical protein